MSTSTPSDPPGYAALRAAEESMFAKVMAGLATAGFDAIKAARTLGLPTPGGVIVFRDETDSAACSDYLLTETRVAGRTLVQAADPATALLAPLEAEILEAYRCSRTSLFELTAVLFTSHQIRLRDLLEPARPEVLLTDPQLSEWYARMRPWPLLFLRLLEVRGITMSSGMHLSFDAESRDRLRQAYLQKINKAPPEAASELRFRLFYQKYRERSGPHAAVEPPSA